MARDREKYEYAIVFKFRGGCRKQAEDDFNDYVAYLNRKKRNVPVRTKAKYKKDNQKFDQLLIIVR